MKHFTGLAHIALFTKDLKTSTAFYEALGGVVTDHADVEKPTGTNHITMVQMPGFFLEIIEPHGRQPCDRRRRPGSPILPLRWTTLTRALPMKRLPEFPPSARKNP